MRRTFTLVTKEESVVQRTLLMAFIGGYDKDHAIFKPKL